MAESSEASIVNSTGEKEVHIERETSKSTKPFDFTPARQESFAKAQATRNANLAAKRAQREALSKRLEAVLSTVPMVPIESAKDTIIMVPPQPAMQTPSQPPPQSQPMPEQTSSEAKQGSSESIEHKQMEEKPTVKDKKRRRADVRRELLLKMFDNEEDEDDEDEFDPILRTLKAAEYLKDRASRARRKLREKKRYYDSDASSEDSDYERYKKEKKRKKNVQFPEESLQQPPSMPPPQPMVQGYRSIFDPDYNKYEPLMNPATTNAGLIPPRRPPDLRHVNQPVGLSQPVNPNKVVFQRHR